MRLYPIRMLNGQELRPESGGNHSWNNQDRKRKEVVLEFRWRFSPATLPDFPRSGLRPCVLDIQERPVILGLGGGLHLDEMRDNRVEAG